MGVSKGRGRAPGEVDKATQRRRDEILATLGEMDEATETLAVPLVTEIAWMEGRLSATRDLLRGTQVVVRYDNGGGQSGIRRNPAFEGYHQLFKSYTTGLRTLRELTGREVEPNAERPGKLEEMRKGSPLYRVV